MGQDVLLSGIFTLVVIVPWIAVTVRRLHDTNRRGWWLMAIVVPIVLFIALATQASLAGADPTDSPFAFYGLLGLLVLSAISLFVFMVLPGNDGPNRFGPDPYRPHDQLEEIFA